MTDKIQDAKDWLKSVRALGIKPDVLDTLDTLERGLVALEKKPEPKKPDPLERFVPKMDEDFFLVCDSGRVVEIQWDDDCFDNYHLDTGNCYRTREQAEKVAAMLKRIIELRGTFKFDLNDPEQRLWYVAYNRKDKEWVCNWGYMVLIVDIPFETKEAGLTLIKEFGDDLFLLFRRI